MAWAEGKTKPKFAISANLKIQFTQKEKLQGTKGRRKEHHCTSQDEQVTLWVGWRKLRGQRKRNGGAMLYLKGLQNAGTQRV
jgi:hypothetical protein